MFEAEEFVKVAPRSSFTHRPGPVVFEPLQFNFQSINLIISLVSLRLIADRPILFGRLDRYLRLERRTETSALPCHNSFLGNETFDAYSFTNSRGLFHQIRWSDIWDPLQRPQGGRTMPSRYCVSSKHGLTERKATSGWFRKARFDQC